MRCKGIDDLHLVAHFDDIDESQSANSPERVARKLTKQIIDEIGTRLKLPVDLNNGALPLLSHTVYAAVA